jgi:hypothetical protein
MTQLLVAAAVTTVALAVALVLRRRRLPDAPTQPVHELPVQLDRADFARPDAPWLVAVFSSATCHTCADVARKAKVLDTAEVAVVDVEFGAARDLHQRYGIDAVPIVVIADRDGVVKAGFVGPVSATDLWAAVAEVREPGSSPEPDLGRTPEQPRE